MYSKHKIFYYLAPPKLLSLVALMSSKQLKHANSPPIVESLFTPKSKMNTKQRIDNNFKKHFRYIT